MLIRLIMKIMLIMAGPTKNTAELFQLTACLCCRLLLGFSWWDERCSEHWSVTDCSSFQLSVTVAGDGKTERTTKTGLDYLLLAECLIVQSSSCMRNANNPSTLSCMMRRAEPTAWKPRLALSEGFFLAFWPGSIRIRSAGGIFGFPQLVYSPRYSRGGRRGRRLPPPPIVQLRPITRTVLIRAAKLTHQRMH